MGPPHVRCVDPAEQLGHLLLGERPVPALGGSYVAGLDRGRRIELHPLACNGVGVDPLQHVAHRQRRLVRSALLDPVADSQDVVGGDLGEAPGAQRANDFVFDVPAHVPASLFAFSATSVSQNLANSATVSPDRLASRRSCRSAFASPAGDRPSASLTFASSQARRAFAVLTAG